MSDPNRVTQLPPTISIKDPDVRQFADALINVLDLRSGNTNKDSPDRFITARDIQNSLALSSGAGFSGLGSPGGTGLEPGGGGPNEPGAISDAIASLTQNIKSSLLYELLHTPFSPITPPEELVQDLRSQMETIADGLDNGITELNDISETSTSSSAKTLWALKNEVQDTETGLPLSRGFIAQMNDSKVTSTHAAVNNFRGMYAALYDENTGLAKVNAAITELNKVDVTTTSALASRVNVLSSDFGINGNTYFQTEAPTGTVAKPLTRYDLWFDTNDGNKVYKWNGSQWITTDLSRLTSTISRVLTEETTRAGQTYSLAQAINTIWASVGGSTALIQDANLASVTKAAVEATSWKQVQSEIIDVNGNSKVAAIRQDLTSYISNTDLSLYSFYGVRAILPTGGTTVNATATASTETNNIKGARKLYLSSTSGIAVGMYVYGNGLPLGTVVNSIDSTTAVTISNALLSPASGGYKFSTKRMVVGGFGLAAQGNGTSGTVDFGVSVDKFWVSSTGPLLDFEAYVDSYPDLLDSYNTNFAGTLSKANAGATHYYVDGAREGRTVPTKDEYIPFIIQSSATYDSRSGTYLPPGVYLKNAFIQDASIDTAKIRNLSVKTLKISDNAVTQAVFVQANYESWHSWQTPWKEGYLTATIYPAAGDSVLYPAKYLIVYSAKGGAVGDDTNLSTRIRYTYTQLNDTVTTPIQANYESVSVRNGFTNLTTFMTLVSLTVQCKSINFIMDVGNDWSRGSMKFVSGKMAIFGAKK